MTSLHKHIENTLLCKEAEINILTLWKYIYISTNSGLDIKACPGHVDLVPRHINFCGYVPDWASDSLVRACTYFPGCIHKFYRVCTNIGWAR